jgi:hypothetical protein
VPEEVLLNKEEGRRKREEGRGGDSEMGRGGGFFPN